MASGAPAELSVDRLRFLARIPTLLNSSLETKQIISVSVQHLRKELEAEAATVYLRSGKSKELRFWAVQGSGSEHLQEKKISADVGIVGWVVSNRESVIVNDVKNDPRFFGRVDQESGFQTRSMLCAPLLSRGRECIGAIQVLNRVGEKPFLEEDLSFLEQFAHQASLAIENARLFEELKTRAHQLATMDRRKQEVITVIAHEFRTPLNIIQNSAEMLGESNLSAQDRQAVVTTLQSGVSRLTAVVGKIKTASAVGSEQLKVSLQPVALLPLFQELQTLYAEPIAGRGLTLSVDILSGTDPVLADPALLMVAMKNLVSNAIRFTADGGSISLRARPQAGLVEITVQDTGIGIAEAELPLIFEKFYEVTDALEHSSGTFQFRSCGLGLGLAAVKTILEAHQSQVEVTSRLGSGSEFRFCLKTAV